MKIITTNNDETIGIELTLKQLQRLSYACMLTSDSKEVALTKPIREEFNILSRELQNVIWTKDKWTCDRPERKYLPTELTGNRQSVIDQINQIIFDRGQKGYCEAFTDQIVVYVGDPKHRRRVACYIP